MQVPQQFCVRWNSYKTNLQTAFPKLLTSEHFVDVTLACDKQYLKCHKIVLSACSVYFEELLVNNPCQHPIIFMKDVAFWEMKALVEFMYKGEVNVSQEQLDSLLKSAESLQIRGLSGAVQWAGMGEDSGRKRKRTEEHVATEEEEEDVEKVLSAVKITNCKSERKQEENDIQKSPSNSCQQKLIKEESIVQEQSEDPSYLDNTDEDDDTKEDFDGGTEEAGPSNMSESTSLSTLALNSVECVIDQDRKINKNSNEHDYTNPEDSSINITHVTSLVEAPKKVFRTILPAPAKVECDRRVTKVDCSVSSKSDCDRRIVRKENSNFNRIRRSEEELSKAAEMVRGGLTFQTASDTFNIPISTIRFYMARRGILPLRRRGRGQSVGGRDDDLIHPPFEIVHYRLPDIDKPV